VNPGHRRGELPEARLARLRWRFVHEVARQCSLAIPRSCLARRSASLRSRYTGFADVRRRDRHGQPLGLVNPGIGDVTRPQSQRSRNPRAISLPKAPKARRARSAGSVPGRLVTEVLAGRFPVMQGLTDLDEVGPPGGAMEKRARSDKSRAWGHLFESGEAPPGAVAPAEGGGGGWVADRLREDVPKPVSAALGARNVT